jgi:hypothetical protein
MYIFIFSEKIKKNNVYIEFFFLILFPSKKTSIFVSFISKSVSPHAVVFLNGYNLMLNMNPDILKKRFDYAQSRKSYHGRQFGGNLNM